MLQLVSSGVMYGTDSPSEDSVRFTSQYGDLYLETIVHCNGVLGRERDD